MGVTGAPEISGVWGICGVLGTNRLSGLGVAVTVREGGRDVMGGKSVVVIVSCVSAPQPRHELSTHLEP